MANQEPFSFGNKRKPEEQIPHSGVHGYEQPHEGAVPVTHEIPADDIPQTMPFNPKDKKLAREVQRRNKKWYERTAVRIGGGVLAGAVAVGGGMIAANSGPDKPDSSSELDAGQKDPEAIAVDGNLYPDKANPSYDEIYGIYADINPDGTLKIDELSERLGLVTDYRIPMEDGYKITQTNEQIAEQEDFDIYDERAGILNKTVVPNFEAAINLINMNNPTVQASRADNEKLSEDESLLLQGADLQGTPIKEFLSYSADTDYEVSALPGLNSYDTLVSLSPGDASLRATVCPFDDGETPTPDICLKAQEFAESTGGEAVEYSTFVERGDSALDTMGPDNPEEYITRTLDGEVGLGVVWTNAQAEIVRTEKITLPVSLWVLGENPSGLDNAGLVTLHDRSE